MPHAEIVAIGAELLLGEIVDTNTQAIATRLRSIGVELRRSTTVGDDTERIADALREALARADLVVACGGLGPTVDDVTREASAIALGTDVVFREDLWADVQDAFRRFGREPSPNNRRQAFVPEGARVIPNPVGTAPAFWVDTGSSVLVVLPGVPRELEHLMDTEVVPAVTERWDDMPALVIRVLHTAGVGESALDARIAEELRSTDPIVGLAAHPGQVDVRITATGPDEAHARAAASKMERRIRDRAGRWIVGADDATLDTVVRDVVTRRAWRVAVVEAGTRGALAARICGWPGFAGAHVRPEQSDEVDVGDALVRLQEETGADVGISAVISREGSETQATITVRTPDRARTRRVPLGGHAAHVPARAGVIALLWLLRAAEPLRDGEPPGRNPGSSDRGDANAAADGGSRG